MKDTEFFELLNLYLDHEITAADAARLEAEVQSNPKRRAVYHEYCRMQKACTLLAKDFVEQPAERKVVAFEPRRSSWSPGLFATGGLALAAACVALVMINRAPTANSDAATPLAPAVAATTVVPAAAKTPEVLASAAVEPATVISRTVTTTPMRRNEVRPMMASVPRLLANGKADNSDAVLVSAQQSSQAQFEWMKNVQLTPIQQLPMSELRLDARSPLQPATRTYMRGQPAEDSAHWVAFRFQK